MSRVTGLQKPEPGADRWWQLEAEPPPPAGTAPGDPSGSTGQEAPGKHGACTEGGTAALWHGPDHRLVPTALQIPFSREIEAAQSSELL